MLLKEAVCPEGGSTFQKTWCEPVLSSPLVRSPHPKYRSPSSRFLYSLTGLPKGAENTFASGSSTTPIPSSSSSAAKTRPEGSEKEIRKEFREMCAVAASVERDISSSPDISASTGSQSFFSIASEAYSGGLPSGNIPTRKRFGARAVTSTVAELARIRMLLSSWSRSFALPSGLYFPSWVGGDSKISAKIPPCWCRQPAIGG